MSPIFKPLVRKGKLIRRVVGYKDKGKELYETRLDPSSNRECIIHFHHAVESKKPSGPVRPAGEVERYGS